MISFFRLRKEVKANDRKNFKNDYLDFATSERDFKALSLATSKNLN